MLRLPVRSTPFPYTTLFRSSGDGVFVAFDSDATNLVAGDTNLVRDTFLRNRLTGKTIRLNESPEGGQGNAASADPSFSFDGTYIAFGSSASNLVAGDTNAVEDVFVRRQHDVLPVPLPMVVDPGPGRGLVLALTAKAWSGPASPTAIPAVVLRAGESLLGVYAGQPGADRVAIEAPSPLPAGVQVRGFWLEGGRGAPARLTPASVTAVEQEPSSE